MIVRSTTFHGKQALEVCKRFNLPHNLLEGDTVTITYSVSDSDVAAMNRSLRAEAAEWLTLELLDGQLSEEEVRSRFHNRPSDGYLKWDRLCALADELGLRRPATPPTYWADPEHYPALDPTPRARHSNKFLNAYTLVWELPPDHPFLDGTCSPCD